MFHRREQEPKRLKGEAMVRSKKTNKSNQKTAVTHHGKQRYTVVRRTKLDRQTRDRSSREQKRPTLIKM